MLMTKINLLSFFILNGIKTYRIFENSRDHSVLIIDNFREEAHFGMVVN